MIKALFFAILAIFSTLPAIHESIVEVKAGYFMFSDSKMRKIFDKGGVNLQLCSYCPLHNFSCDWSLNAYAALEYFHFYGKSLNGDQKTSLWSIPVNIGLKTIYVIDSDMQYYFAFGPRYFYIHQHNCSEYVSKNRSRNGIGVFANTGINYCICNGIEVDLFGEYSYAKFKFHRGRSNSYSKKTQVGGYTFGTGLGYHF